MAWYVYFSHRFLNLIPRLFKKRLYENEYVFNKKNKTKGKAKGFIITNEDYLKRKKKTNKYIHTIH